MVGGVCAVSVVIAIVKCSNGPSVGVCLKGSKPLSF